MKMRYVEAPGPQESANDTWRAWLMTGVRRGPVDRRRIRGAHMGIKKMLVEGMQVNSDRPYTWKDFSDAMVRQSVGDAVRSLPHQDSQLVKLAYFGGMSNREIAEHMQMAEGTVERRLRRALDTISRFIEHGRGWGRRVLAGLVVWLSGRWIADMAQHLAPAGAVAVATVIVLAAPAAPSHNATTSPSAHAAAPSTTVPDSVIPPVPSPTAPANAQSDGAGAATAAGQTVTGALPKVSIPTVRVLPLSLPSPSPLPLPVKKPVL